MPPPGPASPRHRRAGSRSAPWRTCWPIRASGSWPDRRPCWSRRRLRPAILLAGTRRRGREAAGLGYLSGHAGVAVALGAAAFPRLGPGGRALTLGAVPVVGVSRIYVGAHLPLDVAGGAALGLVLDAAL